MAKRTVWHLYLTDKTECVDKKDAQQKHRTKVRCFCVSRKILGEIGEKSLKVENLVPFFQIHALGDA